MRNKGRITSSVWSPSGFSLLAGLLRTLNRHPFPQSMSPEEAAAWLSITEATAAQWWFGWGSFSASA
eukprot:15481484-Alexandrium_andersonii.AAC.1